MCGRFTLRANRSQLQEFFDIVGAPEVRPRFNVAPTQTVPVICTSERNRVLALMSWGLIPSWAKDRKISSGLINARADTVASKPSFRSAFKRRRCLIPADGFYEWQTIGKEKYPYFIHRKDDGLFAFAGLWETWTSPLEETLETCCLITTTPNDLMEPIHDRMPVILPKSAYARWLETPETEAATLTSLLVPAPSEDFAAYRVSRLVNKPQNDVPQCIVQDERGAL